MDIKTKIIISLTISLLLILSLVGYDFYERDKNEQLLSVYQQGYQQAINDVQTSIVRSLSRDGSFLLTVSVFNQATNQTVDQQIRLGIVNEPENT